MTRRDTSIRESEQDDLNCRMEDRYLRLRCLELAVKMADPDEAVTIEVFQRANDALSYIINGTVPEP
jgi:hypothetical protein